MAVSKAAPKKKIKKVKKAAKKKSTDKANRKADPSNTEDAAAAKARNPKAFVFSGRGKAKLQQARSAERDQKRMHGVCCVKRDFAACCLCSCMMQFLSPGIKCTTAASSSVMGACCWDNAVQEPLLSLITHNHSLFAVPVVDTTPEEPPPFVVVVHGPPGVGKTTLIKNLIKHYVNQNLSEVKGPITVVSGKTRRLTFVECPQVGLCVKSELCRLFHQWVFCQGDATVVVHSATLCTQQHAVPEQHLIGSLHPCPIMFMHCKWSNAYKGNIQASAA